MMKRILLLAFILLSLPMTAYADEPVDGRAGRAELRFLEGMIDHHQMALDMANDCLVKAVSEAVQTLCAAIIEAQSAEIELMRSWLLDWYNTAYTPVSMLNMANVPADDVHAGHAGMAMPNSDPSMMMGMFAGLNRLEGIDYEIAWLEAMIDHHDDALHMSNRILARAAHADLLNLARAIIDAQSTEIAYMESLIEELNDTP